MTDSITKKLEPTGYLNTMTGHIWTPEEQPDAAEHTGIYEPLVRLSDAVGLLEVERQRAASLSKSEWKMAGELGEALAEIAELREKLAKPVVLPGRFKPGISKVEIFKGAPVMALDGTGGWLNRVGVIAAIKTNGFNVEGE